MGWRRARLEPLRTTAKGRHCCSVGELKITFASTCKELVFNVLFNVLFLVLDFPLGAPNTLLEHVIERSIWRIVVGEGSWWGWGFSQDWWLGFWSCWNLSLTAVFWIDFSVACFKRVQLSRRILVSSHYMVYAICFSFMLLMPRYALT